MTDIAIRVDNLSKRDRIGAAQERHNTLRDALAARLRRNGHASETNTIWALKDVSFEVKRGEVVGVIGRNGAGKSTLLKILSRITEPTSGRAEIHGRVGSLLEVGTGFHPELTGRENIYLNGAILGMKRTEIAARFDEIVAFAEVEKFLDTPVKRYSSGMYVRLAFAVAAHLEPEILLVDEVLAVGDISFQRKCLGKMDAVAKEGRTVVFVSHNMVAVENLCSRGFLMRQGILHRIENARNAVRIYLSECQDSTAPSSRVMAENHEHGIALLGISAVDTQGEKLEFVRSGEDLLLSMNIRTARQISRLVATVGLNDPYNTRVCVLHSDIAGYELTVGEGAHTILCRVPRLIVVPGEYKLDIHLFSGTDSILWAPGLGTLQIAPGDFYNRGKLPDPSWAGYFYVEQSWTVEN